METRRNFLKKIGLAGLVVPSIKETLSKGGVEKGFGSEFIEQVLGQYKTRKHIFHKNIWYSDKENYYTSLKNKLFNLKLIYGGSSPAKKVDEFGPLYVAEDYKFDRKDEQVFTILKNKQGLYSVNFDFLHIEFREGGELFYDWVVMKKIAPFHDKDFFKPYKELHNLVWEDIKRKRDKRIVANF